MNHQRQEIEMPLSKNLFNEILDTFEDVYGRQITQAARGAYWKTLSIFTDEQVRKAGYVLIEIEQRLPTPAAFKTEITRHLPQTERVYHGSGYTMKTTTCENCMATTMCINEYVSDGWLCRECYSGISFDGLQKRLRYLAKGERPLSKNHLFSIK